MGIDVVGLSSKNDSGSSRRMNYFNWGVILSVCQSAIEIYQLPFSVDGWGLSDGEGLDSQQDCDRLAAALEAFLDTNESNCFFTATEGVLTRVDCSDDTDKRLSDHNIIVHNLRDWIMFLYNCGGFQCL